MEDKKEVTTEEVKEVIAEENANDDLHGENLTDRVKALSPAATVAKRFFRSKLSIVGLVTIIVLFIFSFIGPFFSPWGQTEVDTGYEDGDNGRKNDGET